MKPKFGITSLGNHTILKLNAKLSPFERKSLADAYPDLLIREIGKGLTRIEGCISNILYHESFAMEFQLAMKRSKLTALHDEIMSMEETQRQHAAYYYSSTLNEL